MRREGGFTTLELLIALGALAIVLTISSVVVLRARADARDAMRIANVKEMQAGLRLFFTEQYTFPVAGSPIVLGKANTICLGMNGFSGTCDTNRPYMATVPSNVSPGGSAYLYSSRNAENAACSMGPCAAYTLQFSLERNQGGLTKGYNCARLEGITAGPCR